MKVMRCEADLPASLIFGLPPSTLFSISSSTWDRPSVSFSVSASSGQSLCLLNSAVDVVVVQVRRNLYTQALRNEHSIPLDYVTEGRGDGNAH